VTKTVVIIVAAGRGSRAGNGPAKQYRSIAGVPLLRRTLNTVSELLPTALIQVVIGPDDIDLYNQATVGIELLPPVTGGASRQESVYNGLKAAAELEPTNVLVHDAARPFISANIIAALMDSLAVNSVQAVVPVVPIVDTLNRVSEGAVTERVDRQGLYSVQTPQGFKFSALLEAHRSAKGSELTDDGAVMEAAGHKVHVCTGDGGNFKITHEEDFMKAETCIMNGLGDIRTGTGYDVHRFEAGDHLWLCGVQLPFTKTLKGHSDADVALHAVTDAILSAVAEGDIGTHFPPNDEKWRGASSDIFVRRAAEIIREKSGVVANIAVCIVCEEPKVGPHRALMTERLASLLDIDPKRVSVQATTTEKLGFTGRKEGIAAQATATIRLPWQRS